MLVSSPSQFAAAVAEHPFPEFRFEADTIERARRSLEAAGLLLVGEPHGVRETPSVLYALSSLLGTCAVAFEWPHEELEEPVRAFLAKARSTSCGSGRCPPRRSSSAATAESRRGTSRSSSGSSPRDVSTR